VRYEFNQMLNKPWITMMPMDRQWIGVFLYFCRATWGWSYGACLL